MGGSWVLASEGGAVGRSFGPNPIRSDESSTPSEPSPVPYEDEEDADEEAGDPGRALPPGEEADGALDTDDEDEARQEEEVAWGLGVVWCRWIGMGMAIG